MYIKLIDQVWYVQIHFCNQQKPIELPVKVQRALTIRLFCAIREADTNRRLKPKYILFVIVAAVYAHRTETKICNILNLIFIKNKRQEKCKT